MKKKICFYINALLVGGIEKVLIELLKNIDLEKYEVTLLITYNLGEVEKLKSDIPKEIKIKYLLNEEMLVKGKRKKVLGNLKTIEKLFDESISWIRKIIIEKRLLEYVENQDTMVDFDMTLAPYCKKIKNKIITFCHFSPKNYNRGIKRRQIKHGKRLNDYDKVVVISDDMKKEMIELYPFLENKVVRIYNSMNIKNIEEQATIIREEDKIFLNDEYILAIGRLEETQKDFSTLLKAYALIEKNIKEKLYIIGDGRHKNNLEQLVKELEIEDRVKFLGFIRNPYPFIKNSKIFVHSSKFEGLPTVLIEAIILGKAIVSTDCPTGPREILTDGYNGVLTKLSDKNDMAKKIEKILMDKNIREEFERRTLEKRKEFDSNLVIKELEKIL